HASAAQAVAWRVRGDPAHGHARGRVAALPSRWRAGDSLRLPPPADLSAMKADGAPRSDRGEPRSSNVIQAVPGLVRISAVAWTRTARWSVATSWRAGSRL